MRPAVSTVSLHHLTLLPALDCAAEAGFRELELLMIPGWVHLHPGSMTPAALAQEVGQRGLHLVGVHGGGINGTSDASLAVSLQYLRQLIPFAAAAGADFLNINGEPVPAGTSADARARMLERIADGLGELEPLVRGVGLRVTLENHYGCHIEFAEDYAAIFRRHPQATWLGATVDTGHCTLSGVDIPELVRGLGARVLHVHLKDQRGRQAVPLGEGEIDNLTVVRILRSQGYAGCLSAELELESAAAQRSGLMAALPHIENLIAAA